jgi:hypothetical protein
MAVQVEVGGIALFTQADPEFQIHSFAFSRAVPGKGEQLNVFKSSVVAFVGWKFADVAFRSASGLDLVEESGDSIIVVGCIAAAQFVHVSGEMTLLVDDNPATSGKRDESVV